MWGARILLGGHKRMDSRELVMTALQLGEPDRVPFADFVDTSVKQKIMGTDRIDEAAFAKRIGMDAIYFDDYLTPIFCEKHYVTDAVNGVERCFEGEGIIRSEKDLKEITLPDPNNDGFYDPAKKFIDTYGNSDLAMYASLRPFGMFNTFYSMPMMDFAVALHENLSLIHTIMDIFIEWNLVILENLQKIGIDFICAYNIMAYKSGPLVSPQAFREVFLPKMKMVAEAIHVPWAFHSDGDLSLVMEDLLSLGMNAMHPIEPPCMDLKEVKIKWGDRVCLWGNIDMIHTLPYGTVDEVEAEVKQKIKDAGSGGGYICGSANSITEYCKVENVLAMTRAVKDHGAYDKRIDSE